jgi:aspartate kinase
MDVLLTTGEQVSIALLAMALNQRGVPARSFTGGQVRVLTTSAHGRARIQNVETDRLRIALDEGVVPVVAGFQGTDADGNITTIGRGGSDTTAVALAVALKADECQILTDVDGVYTTDPRVVPEARRMARISYDEMLELASLGAGVMHSRSIEFGKKFDTPIHVRSSFTDQPGTMIVAVAEQPDLPVSGAAITKDEARITVSGVPDKPGNSQEIFTAIAAKNIPVDMIVQNVAEGGKAEISFTVPRNELKNCLEAVHQAAKLVGASGVTSDDNVSKVSVVGMGMARQTGVADRMFRALAEAGINIQMITTGEIKISVLVHRDQAQQALRVVHQAFELHKPPAKPVQPLPPPSEATNIAEVIARLQGVSMEDLTIDAVDLDASQARVTIRGVPDQPGIAAKVFEDIAAAGVFVDMIIQSFPSAEEQATLSFTVPRSQLDQAVAAAKQIATGLACRGVTSSPKIAKLSVSGVGLRTHTGVAARMFKALADAGINVDLINTSEVRVNVIVDDKYAHAGLKKLQEAFADVLR